MCNNMVEFQMHCVKWKKSDSKSCGFTISFIWYSGRIKTIGSYNKPVFARIWADGEELTTEDSQEIWSMKEWFCTLISWRRREHGIKIISVLWMILMIFKFLTKFENFSLKQLFPTAGLILLWHVMIGCILCPN